jgi:hypothetical protein
MAKTRNVRTNNKRNERMKKVLFITMLSLLNLSYMHATEVRDDMTNMITIMGFEAPRQDDWETIDCARKEIRSGFAEKVNSATICTYFAESISEITHEKWISGQIKPIVQIFRYDDSTESIVAENPYIGVNGNGQLGYIFTYNERIKIDGVKYDQIRVGSSFTNNECGTTYFLDKFKD